MVWVERVGQGEVGWYVHPRVKTAWLCLCFYYSCMCIGNDTYHIHTYIRTYMHTYARTYACMYHVCTMNIPTPQALRCGNGLGMEQSVTLSTHWHSNKPIQVHEWQLIYQSTTIPIPHFPTWTALSHLLNGWHKRSWELLTPGTSGVIHPACEDPVTCFWRSCDLHVTNFWPCM